MTINPANDRALATFFDSDAGKVALSALMEEVGWSDMMGPMDGATANFINGEKSVVARILLAYARLTDPAAKPNLNPLGFTRLTNGEK